MATYPRPIKCLIECFKKLPGIGEKTAERMALSIMNLTDEQAELFACSLRDVKSKIIHCKICHNLSESDICEICKDPNRDHHTICVVETAKNVISWEKVGTYHGDYHVLDGLISPLNGKNPEDIHLNELIKRIRENDIREVILAITPTIEGETTSLYIVKKLEHENVIVSKIAHGVPLGADMEYIDSLTLEMALEDRKAIVNK